jgi:hypothetical protein
MRTKTAMMIVLMTALIFGLEAFAMSPIQVQSVRSQIVGSPDGAGNVQIIVTANVWNPTMYGTDYYVRVQGVDSNGSPLTRVTLWGWVAGRGSGTLVGQGSLPEAYYGSIANWVLVN